jgi:hypothetical protein
MMHHIGSLYTGEWTLLESTNCSVLPPAQEMAWVTCVSVVNLNADDATPAACSQGLGACSLHSSRHLHPNSPALVVWRVWVVRCERPK